MGSVDGSVVLKKREQDNDKVSYPHLIWRKTGKDSGRWYYRHDLSPALREIFGKREIRKSLRTSDKAVARRRYHKMALEVEELIRDALNGSPARSEYGKLKKGRNRSYNKAKRDPAQFLNHDVEWTEWGQDRQGRPVLHELMDPETTSLEAAFISQENRRLRTEIARLREDKSLGIGDGRKLDVQIEARESLITGIVPASEPDNSKLPKFSQIALEYLADVKEGIGERALYKREHDFDEFQRFCTNKPIDRYDVSDGRKYYDRLRVTIARGTENPLKPKTIKIRLNHITNLFRFARTRYGKTVENPVEGFKAPRIKQKFTDAVRRTYTPDELNTLFLLLKKDVLYWPVLLALYTGVREQAVVQLSVEDIQTVDGVTSIHFHDVGDNKLKSPASLFTLPVHETLINLGFTDFVDTVRQDERRDAPLKGRLFPQFLWTKHSGFKRKGSKGSDLWADRLGKRYAAFLKKAGLKDRKLTFHSLRHSYVAACRDADIYDGMRHWLQGRAESGSAGGYARDRKTAKLSVMKKYINQIRYGIDIEAHR